MLDLAFLIISAKNVHNPTDYRIDVNKYTFKRITSVIKFELLRFSNRRMIIISKIILICKGGQWHLN